MAQILLLNVNPNIVLAKANVSLEYFTVYSTTAAYSLKSVSAQNCKQHRFLRCGSLTQFHNDQKTVFLRSHLRNKKMNMT